MFICIFDHSFISTFVLIKNALVDAVDPSLYVNHLTIILSPFLFVVHYRSEPIHQKNYRFNYCYWKCDCSSIKYPL